MGTHIGAVPIPIIDQMRTRVVSRSFVVSHAARESQLGAGAAREFRCLLLFDELLSVFGATKPVIGGRELGRSFFGKHFELFQGLQPV